VARAKARTNGRLEEAMATLLQNQALFLGQMADMNHRIEERFARLEAILFQHSQILNEHTRILQALPEAVREKIGFNPPA
jgi:hypothetical protein